MIDHIQVKDKERFALAGIYTNQNPISKFIKDVGTEMAKSQSCAILTTSPNNLMEPIHDRMPVIISKENEKLWLDPDIDLNDLLKFFDPYPADEMMAYPVSTFVNSNKNDTEKCI